jgi:hypothetical protein
VLISHLHSRFVIACATLVLIVTGCSQQQVPFAAVTSSPPGGTSGRPNLEAIFPVGLNYGDGSDPSVAFASPTTVVDEHEKGLGDLYATVGSFANDAVAWYSSIYYQHGIHPAIAVSGTTVVDVHESPKLFNESDLWYEVGRIDDDHVIRYGPSFKYDVGTNPKVAFVGSDTVVEVHEDTHNKRLFSQVGVIDSGKIRWSDPPVQYDSGFSPAVAANSQGWLVEVHRNDNGDLALIHYRVGRFDSATKTIAWSASMEVSRNGHSAHGRSTSVALTDDGRVVVAFEGAGENDPYHRIETITTITGALQADVSNPAASRVDWYGFDRTTPSYSRFTLISPASVAANGDHALAAFSSEGSLYAAASLLSDRANWMSDRLSSLGTRPLREIVFPGSHDAGMYGTPGALGIAQDQSLYDQLSGGVRWFDLRVNSDLRIFHGPIVAEPLSEVLNDIRRYLSEGHREVVILDFGVTPGNKDVLKKFFDMGTGALGPWLYDNKTGKRLADIPLNTLLESGKGVVIPLMNWDERSTGVPGYYTKRNWDIGSTQNPGNPTWGQVTLFDSYSNTIDFSKMENDQLKKFADFDGKMEYAPDFPCDLFLLAWTLTPVLNIDSFAIIADARLGTVMTEVNRNKYGLIPNIINTDFYEWSGSTDVAITMNERFNK